MKKLSKITAYFALFPTIYSFYINSSIKNICLLGCLTTIFNHSTRGKNKHLLYSNSKSINHILIKELFQLHHFFSWVDRFVMIYIFFELNDFIYLNLLTTLIFLYSRIIWKKYKKQKDFLHALCHIFAVLILFKEIEIKKK